MTLNGHETSLALEPEFWAVLQDMAQSEQLGIAHLLRRLDETRQERPLASACRVAALQWVLARRS